MRISEVLILSLLFMLCSCNKQDEVPSVDDGLRHEPANVAATRSYSLEHAFGVVDKNGRYEAAVELENSDGTPIILEFSKTSCGCLALLSMPKKIEPGDTGVLEVAIDTTGRRGLLSQEAIYWDAKPMECLVTLEVTATVRSYWANPEVISFGDRMATDQVTKELSVTAAGYPTARVLSVSTDAEWITLTKKELTAGPDSQAHGIHAIAWYDVVWNGSAASPGGLSSKIVVEIETDAVQTLEVPVTGFLSGNVDITPGRLVFGLVGKTEIVRRCTLRFNHSVDLAEVKVTAEHPVVTAELAKDENASNQFVLTARAVLSDEVPDQKLLEGSIRGTDAGGTATFCIPYTGVVDRHVTQ
jgi:uncharacterized protein DUF1573